MAKLLLLDGNSLTYRAFFALPADMATASGQTTNAVFGFTSMLVNLLKDQKPDRIVVAFDRPEPTFRHAIVDTYKAQREAAPDILRQQMGLVRQVLESLNISTIELAGYEADDLIGTLAKRGEVANYDVVVVTGDRDAYQLVNDPKIKVLYNRRGVSDYVLYDEAGIKEKTGVEPNKYAEYAALRGDPSDNLPGVPGVGEKTAAKLINDFGSIDGIYENLDSLSPKLKENLKSSEELVRTNAKATPLVLDVPIELDLEDAALKSFDHDAARNLFQFLEFRTLWDRLLDATGAAAPDEKQASLEVSVTVLDDQDVAKHLTKLCDDHFELAVAGTWAAEAGRSELTGMALVNAGESAAIYFRTSALSDGGVVNELRSLLSSAAGVIHVHDAKLLMRALEPLGVPLENLGLDTRVAAYLLDPSDSTYPLMELVPRYTGHSFAEGGVLPTGQFDFGERDLGEETAGFAVATGLLAKKLFEELQARELTSLYETIERPLIRVLARMELYGVRVDVGYLQALTTELTNESIQLEAEIQEIAGEQFKVNSTQQLRKILFEKLGLAPQKKTKTGYSTDASTLEKLVGTHPIIEKILRYREVEKLRSTYGQSLIAEVGSDGRIHASFNQTVARTGRLSSDRPNLHNIPVRSEDGRRFRRAFVPSEGTNFLIADYNQIELRVIAHLSNDPGLIEAFRSKTDVHRATAARVFGVEPQDVTFEQRNRAKMVAYGLAYGMEAYGLAQRLNIGVDEAASILKAFFDAFPNIRGYMESTVAEARRLGYTETLFGRRRPIPELSSDNFRVRQAGERQAMNAGIQGLAADIFKVALIKIDHALIAASLQSRLVLQVHDEVLVEVPENERDVATDLVLGSMESACDLSVPLTVESAYVANWGAAKQ